MIVLSLSYDKILFFIKFMYMIHVFSGSKFIHLCVKTLLSKLT